MRWKTTWYPTKEQNSLSASGGFLSFLCNLLHRQWCILNRYCFIFFFHLLSGQPHFFCLAVLHCKYPLVLMQNSVAKDTHSFIMYKVKYRVLNLTLVLIHLQILIRNFLKFKILWEFFVMNEC